MAKKMNVVIPCDGCGAKNSIPVLKPSYFSPTSTKMTCTNCLSRWYLKVSKAKEIGQVNISQSIIFLSEKLKEILTMNAIAQEKPVTETSQSTPVSPTV